MLSALRSIRAETHQLPRLEPLFVETKPMSAGELLDPSPRRAGRRNRDRPRLTGSATRKEAALAAFFCSAPTVIREPRPNSRSAQLAALAMPGVRRWSLADSSSAPPQRVPPAGVRPCRRVRAPGVACGNPPVLASIGKNLAPKSKTPIVGRYECGARSSDGPGILTSETTKQCQS
jgi:hypothetical protein